MILAFIINWALSLNQMHLPKVTQSQDKRHFLVTPSSTTLHIVVLGQIESKICYILIWNLGLNEQCLGEKIHHLQKFWQFREFQTVNIFNSTFWLKMTHSALVCSYKQEKKDYIHLLTFTIYYQLETRVTLPILTNLLSYWLVSQRNY